MSSASGGATVSANGKGVSVCNNGEQLLTVTLVKDESGYGMKVSGDNPVYIQSVRGGGCAFRAGLRAGDRIHTVNARPARHSTHAQVVDMIKSGGARVVLTVVQSQKSPTTPPAVNQPHHRTSSTTITAPVPVDREKQRQLEFTKIQTIKLMWDNEQLHLEKLRGEDLRDDNRRQEFAAAEARCNILRQQYEYIANSLGVNISGMCVAPATSGNKKSSRPDKDSSVGFLSGLPRSLSNLTSQSLRNLRQNKTKLDDDKRPPSLIGPLQSPGVLDISENYEGMPNSISLQLSYPLIASQSTLQNAGNPTFHHSISQPASNNNSVDFSDGTEESGWELVLPSGGLAPPNLPPAPPGTPPPPYIHNNTQTRVDTQRSIISMEEDDVPTTRWSDGSLGAGIGTCFGPASAAVGSRARCAVLLNLALSERRSPQACALLFSCLADLYSVQSGTQPAYARWAYEIHSAFLVPSAPLQLKCVDEQTAREIDDILATGRENEDALRKVFVKARTKAVEDLQHLVTDFQVKRSVGLGSLYGPPDSVLDKCDTDKTQESVVVQKAVVSAASGVRAHALSANASSAGLLTAAFLTVAHMHLGVRLSVLWNAVCGEGGLSVGTDMDSDMSGSRSNPTPPLFLEPDRRYKRRHKKIGKQTRSIVQKCVPVHNGAPMSVVCTTYCHHCHLLIYGHAPQAYHCQDCELTVHTECWRSVEEGCCGPTHTHNNSHSHPHAHSHSDQSNRISRIMDKIHGHHSSQDNVTSTPLDKKSRKSSSTMAFIQGEKSSRRQEEEPLLSADSLAMDSTILSASTNHSYQVSLEAGVLSLAPIEIRAESIDKNVQHRKTASISNPKDILKTMGEDWLEMAKKEIIDHRARRKSEKVKKEAAAEADKMKIKSKSMNSLSFMKRKKSKGEPVKKTEDLHFNTIDVVAATRTFLQIEIEKAGKEIVQVRLKDEADYAQTNGVSAADEHSFGDTLKHRGKDRSRNSKKSPRIKTGKVATLKRRRSRPRRRGHSVTVSASQERGDEDRTQDDASISTASTSTSAAQDSHGRTKAARPVARASSSASCPARGAQRAQHAPQHKQPRNTSDPSRMLSRSDAGDTSGQQLAASNASSNSSLEQQRDNVELQHAASDSSDWSDDGLVEGNWSEAVPPHVASQLTSKQRKAQELMHELIQSEKSHGRWLKVLKRVFLRPLEKCSLLPQDDVRALFPNLPAIEQHHNQLFQKLSSLKKKDGETDEEKYIMKIEPVADVIYSVLSSPSYSSAVSEFCRCQSMALKSLKERRRKHKELDAFLLAKERHPACERLQLPAILATVWQRLTKYKLLLENLVCTVDEESEKELERLRLAVDTARDVLQTVDDAVKKTENQHRLRSIQAKLEFRTEGGDNQLGLLPQVEDLKRLDLASHNLILEGELNIRQEATKKASVLALFLQDCLVLLHRDGEKFVLKPLHQPSHAALLSPIVEWSTVLFRPNATVKNGFFLANINGVQMYELSANTSSEYNMWAKHISCAPLAYKQGVPMPVLSSSSTTGTGAASVSRNPSDASNASNTSHSNESQSEEPPPEIKNEEKRADSEEPKQDSDSAIPVSSNGRIVIHSDREESPYELYAVPQDVIITPKPQHHIASTHLTHEERLHRVDETLSRCLSQKASLVAEALGVPEDSFCSMAELAVQDLRTTVSSTNEDDPSDKEAGIVTDSEEVQTPYTVHQLLLAAQAQVNQLTRVLWASGQTSSRSSAINHGSRQMGLCDRCTIVRSNSQSTIDAGEASAIANVDPTSEAVHKLDNLVQNGSESALELVVDVQSSLSHLMNMLPTLERERNSLRQQLRTANERLTSMAYMHKDCVMQPAQETPQDTANANAD